MCNGDKEKESMEERGSEGDVGGRKGMKEKKE